MSTPSYTITVHAGPRDRNNCPVRLSLPESLPAGEWTLRADTGETRPLQRLSDKEAVFIERALLAGESRAYRLESQSAPEPAVQLQHEAGKNIEITIHGSLFSRYVYGDVPARPYLFPIVHPSGVRVTRSYPMDTTVPGEMHDHPHHRSVWIAHGEVNGADNWSEEKGHGFTLHKSVDKLESGAVCGQFATTSEWADVNKKPLLTQNLAVTAWAVSDTARMLDFDIRLTATHGEVHFGDTKEGGILSVRVASVLDVPRGGRIENTFGGVNEGETWGKSAHWCDYSGIVDGQRVGIAILDHPLSFRYPTHWHVRDYGLMTANPFGYAAFTNGVKNGSHILPAGESLSWHYRLLVHSGNATEGRVNAHYLNFAAPPRVAIAT